VTREGRSKLGDEVIESKDPRGDSYYWIGARQAALNYPKGTDLHAVENGFVSVTPISLNMTHKPTIKTLKGVFKEN
jgi:5'-nucleotidase